MKKSPKPNQSATWGGARKGAGRDKGPVRKKITIELRESVLSAWDKHRKKRKLSRAKAIERQVEAWSCAAAHGSTGLGGWLPGLPTKPGTYLYAAPTRLDNPRLALVDVVRWRGELVEDLGRFDGEHNYITLTSYKPGRWAGPLKWNATQATAGE